MSSFVKGGEILFLTSFLHSYLFSQELKDFLEEHEKKAIKNSLKAQFPERLADFLRKGFPSRESQATHSPQTEELIQRSKERLIPCHWEDAPSQIQTKGGVSLKEINPKNPESKQFLDSTSVRSSVIVHTGGLISHPPSVPVG